MTSSNTARNRYEIRHRRKVQQLKRRSRILFTLCLLLIFSVCFTVGGTVAYMQTKTGTVTNSFQAGEITYTLNLVANAEKVNHQNNEVNMPGNVDSKSETDLSVAFTLNKKPELTGYIFSGWYYDEHCLVKYDTTDDLNITVNYGDSHDDNTDANKVEITLYAAWEPVTYTVKYDANIPEEMIIGSTADSQHTYDQERTLTENGYQRTGYSFAGWSTNKNATSADYTNKGEVKNLTDAQGAVVTLYAVWSADDVNYTVEHWLQNVNGDDTENESNFTIDNDSPENLTAKADSEIIPAVKAFTGFTAPSTKKVKIEPDGSTVVKYYYKRNSYEVTLKKDNGIDSVIGEGTYKYNASVSIDANLKAGYLWKHWTGDQPSDNQNHTFNMPASNITIKAETTPVSYTIVYNANGVTAGATTSSIHTYDESKQLTANGFSRTGYTFAGWATSETGDKVYDDEESVLNLSSTDGATVNLYAVWTPITYTVIYDGNENTGGSTKQSTHTYDVEAELTANGFIKAGYTFEKWTTEADGTGTSYTDGQQVMNLASSKGEEVTLHAQWKANTNTKYTVEHYQQNIGDEEYSIVAADTQELRGITDTEVEPDVKSYPGFTSPDKKKESIKGDGSTVIQYYYERNSYDLSLTAGRGIKSVSGAERYKYGQSVTISAEPSVGYTWKNWTKAENEFVYAENEYTFTMPDADVTYTANAEAINYSIMYDLAGGDAVSGNPSTYTIESDPITLKNPSRTGYTFAGWKGTDIVGSSTSVTINKGSIGNRSYTAIWTPNQYTIKYNANGGNGTMNDQPMTYDEQYTLNINTFTREEYEFQGWSTDADGSVIYDDGARVQNLTAKDGDTLTLYAIWKQKEYTVTLNWNDDSDKTDSIKVSFGETYGDKSLPGHISSENSPLGKAFIGWYTAADGGDKVLLTTTVTKKENHTLWAHWETVPEIKFGNKSTIFPANYNATIVNNTYDRYTNTFTVHPDDGCEVVYYPITGLKQGSTYTITFDHTYTGGFIRTIQNGSYLYQYGCGIMNSEPEIATGLMTNIGEWASQIFVTDNNNIDHVTFTFTATGNTAYWVWNLADCQDRANNTTTISVTNFSVVHDNGDEVTYYTAESNAGRSVALSLRSDSHDIDFLWDNIDDTNMDWYPVDEQCPTAGDSYELAFEPYEGYEMCEIIKVTIDDEEYEVHTDDTSGPKKKKPFFDPETNILTIPKKLLTSETKKVSVTGSAVKLETEKVTETEEVTETVQTEELLAGAAEGSTEQSEAMTQTTEGSTEQSETSAESAEGTTEGETTPESDETSTEGSTEQSESETESAEGMTEAGETATESVTEKETEPATETVTEKATEPATETVTEKTTEPVTEPVTEKTTEPMTEPVMPVAEATEKVTEKETEKEIETESSSEEVAE